MSRYDVQSGSNSGNRLLPLKALLFVPIESRFGSFYYRLMSPSVSCFTKQQQGFFLISH